MIIAWLPLVPQNWSPTHYGFFLEPYRAAKHLTVSLVLLDLMLSRSPKSFTSSILGRPTNPFRRNCWTWPWSTPKQCCSRHTHIFFKSQDFNGLKRYLIEYVVELLFFFPIRILQKCVMKYKYLRMFVLICPANSLFPRCSSLQLKPYVSQCPREVNTAEDTS